MPIKFSKEQEEVEVFTEKGESAGYSKLGGAFIYFAAITATLNITAMGLSSAYTSSTRSSMNNTSTGIENITDDEITWIASIVQITAIAGALLSGHLSNKLGRKALLLYNSVPFMISWLIVAYADSVSWIYFGRVVMGCCCGIVTVTVATYLTEISTPNNRGRLGTLYPVAFAIGLLGAMTLGMVMTWRWLALFSAAVVTLTAFLLCFIPESPSWLIAHDFESKAYKALKRLRGSSEEAALECKSIADTLSQNQPTLKLSEFRSPQLYKPLLLGLGLVFFQQCIGINALISYTRQIFERAGGSLDPSLATLVIAIIQVPTNLLSTVIIDKAGRRVFHALSGTFLAVGLILIGIFILFSNKDHTFGLKFGWMPVTGYIVFFIALSIGYGPLPFIMITEMTPQHARSVIVGIVTVVIYIAAFTVTKTFEDLQKLLGEHGVYFLYAAIAATGVLFGLICLPETKGKSFEDIQKIFVKEDEIKLSEDDASISSEYNYKF